jgi:hypothetical protein
VTNNENIVVSVFAASGENANPAASIVKHNECKPQTLIVPDPSLLSSWRTATSVGS